MAKERPHNDLQNMTSETKDREKKPKEVNSVAQTWLVVHTLLVTYC